MPQAKASERENARGVLWNTIQVCHASLPFDAALIKQASVIATRLCD
jgi:hypothetical protein